MMRTSRVSHNSISHRPAIAKREWAVLCFGGLTMAFTAWAFSGMQHWSLFTLLAGGLLTFVASIVPLPDRWNGFDGQHSNDENFKRLLKFPFFWLTLLFLIYISIQGFNSSWHQVYVEAGWYVEKLPEESYISWLPTGVRTDYLPVSTLRVFFYYLAAFALAWGLWVGLRRRSTILAALWIFAVNGVAMSIVAIIQKYLEAPKVLWLIKSANPNFWGSFFYRNHGVAFLILILICCAFLYFYHYNRSQANLQKGGPYLLLVVFVFVVALSIALALSRGGILFGGLFASFFILSAGIRGLFSQTFRSSLLATACVVLFVIGSGAYLWRYVDTEAIENRFGDIQKTIENVDTDKRVMATKATWEMSQGHLRYGWGAGSWSYIFPIYQKKHPALFYRYYHKKKGWMGRQYFIYAHNDWAQFLAEYGIVGCSILVLAGLNLAFFVFFRSRGNRMAAFMIIGGTVVILGHAFVEFIFQCPAYWVALFGFASLSVKLLSLSHERSQA